EKLAEILQLQARQAGRTEAGALKYAEAAKIYDEELRNPEQAAAVISKAYECDPSNFAYLEQGARYLVDIGQVDAALSNLKVAIDSGDETSLADLLELRAHIIRTERADDREATAQAARDIRRALEELIPEEQEDSLQGARVEVLGELRNLHREVQDTEAERTVVLELAETLKALGDAAGGVDTLVSWMREHETDIEVARQLGQDATLVEDFSSAMFAYEKMVSESEGDARVDAVLLLVDAADQAGKPAEARAALEDAFAEDSSNARLRDRLRRMYEEAGAFEDLANILLSEADKVEESETRSALLVDVG